MDHKETYDGMRYSFNSNEVDLTQLAPRLYLPEELLSTLLQVQTSAREYQEELFLKTEDEPSLNKNMKDLDKLEGKIIEAIVKEERPTELQDKKFLQDPNSYTEEPSLDHKFFSEDAINEFHTSLNEEEI